MRVHTLMRFFYVCIFLFSVPSLVLAATDVTSDITSDTEWTTDGSPYVVNFANNPYSPHLLTVAPGAVLTIDSGVIVKFGAYNGIAVNGTLHAEATSDNPIIFTSLEDDTAGGDTNGDGTDTTPADKQWMHLQFNTGSIGTFDYAIVRYGGARTIPVFNTGIENYGGTLLINHTTLTHNGYDGFGQYGGHTTITNSFIFDQLVGISMNGGALDVSDTRIYNNGVSGINHRWDGALSITHSEIDHNGTGIVAEPSHGSIAVNNSSIHDNTVGVSNQTEITGYDENGNSYVSDAGITIDALNNWWGTAKGPQDSDVQGNVLNSPWLTSDPFPPADPCVAAGTCVSNVLFLPGIEGSRLYEGTGRGKSSEEKLWEPVGESVTRILQGAGDAKVKDLFLDADGKSVCSDIYAKEGDIVDSVHGSNIYKSFIDEMNGLKSDGTIVDWKPVAYDWRLSLDDLLHNGTERDGKIFYEEASSTPYIEQTLRALAANSKTGKVTIVAHSNGGLVAKALLNQLGSLATKLVDKVIMVGVPQSGAPESVGALLFGLDQGISSNGIPILHSDVARTLADNSPMAYHLLPSEDYLESTIADSAHRVARFAGAAYAKEIAAYGPTIGNRVALADFLLAKEGGRTAPAASDTSNATILNSSLINYATAQHATLDFWTPPEGIEVTQIAGWGVDTVAGVDFYTLPSTSVLTAFGPVRAYRPVFTEDGDGTVPVPSALEMSSTLPNVKRYWVNLKKSQIKHGDLFENIDLQNFIDKLLKDSLDSIPPTILAKAPISSNDKKLTFFLHSPLTLQLTDTSGNVTGLALDDSITQDIPDSNYGEFGDVKYVTVPEGGQYQLVMHGQASGTFSLDIQESSGGIVTTSSTIANVPTTANTLASLTISAGIVTAPALSIDENGDGQNIITITPEVGHTVSYQPPPPVPLSRVISVGGGSISIPAAMLTANPTTTQPVSTSTARVAIITKPIQTKKKSPVVIAPKKANTTTPQTASVYQASQQPIFNRMGAAVYNGLHKVWSILLNIF